MHSDFGLRTSDDDKLPEADDPLRAEDCPPDHHQLDDQHNDGGQQGDREKETILLQIGQRNQGDHQGGDDVAQGERSEQQGGVQY